jgi:predicted RNase H-like HicB family nuclease
MMQYQVLVQSNNENAFIASIIGVPDCVAEGQTREEAIARDALTARLAQGEVVTIEVELSEIAPARNPWLDNFGRFKNDPTFDDFLAEIESNRRASNDDETSK